MSEHIRHKCGIALVRLMKPLEYYQLKYGSWRYGLDKLYLMMEKQRNRGQDGAGVVSLKFDTPPGEKYFHREKSMAESAINVVFEKIYKQFRKLEKSNPVLLNDIPYVKKNLPFAAEVYLGHLQDGTHNSHGFDSVHPVMRENNWKTRNLVIAGNYNLTNVDELFNILIELGQSPKDFSDTVTILEKIGHFLDRENQMLFDHFKSKGYSNRDISGLIAKELNISKTLSEASKRFDGGYVIAGILGHGDSFIFRDPWGIRPAYYYYDDEVGVFASERSVIQTAFNLTFEKVHEVPPGYVVIIKKSGELKIEKVQEPLERKSCSFERIYFSRGSDKEIYNERKKLGELLLPEILKSINSDFRNTVFSFIPNTAETAFYGMIESIENFMVKRKLEVILEEKDQLDEAKLKELISERPRVEKVAIKDAKLRTFISQDKSRAELVGHVYDITYGSLKRGIDNLVIIDDSIVRGTTLKQSILKILDRLGPKKIVIVSSSPQLRYPDCYGIDMNKLDDLIAFRAAIELLREKGKSSIINEVYKKCRNQIGAPKEDYVNYVKEIYLPFSPEDISRKIASLLKGNEIQAEIEIVYQSIENLHKACPNDLGDWYFTGNYPTPGGNKVVSTAFLNFIEGRSVRNYL